MATKDNQATEPSVGELVSDLTQQFSGIAKAEVELAKAELKQDVANGVGAIVNFAIAGVLGLFALGFLLTAGAWGLVAAGLPAWAGFLIVAGVLLLIVAIAALLGIKKIKSVNGKPARAIDHAKKTVEDVKPRKQDAAADISGRTAA